MEGQTIQWSKEIEDFKGVNRSLKSKKEKQLATKYYTEIKDFNGCRETHTV